MDKFAVHCSPDDEAMEELLSRTPFNLKKDLKGMSDELIQEIAEEIANDLHHDIDRPPNLVARFIGKGRKAAWVKIRIVDVQRDAGKSHGYRCIALVDMVHRHAFLLHLYRHSHGERDNISDRDENKLKALVEEYTESLNSIKWLSRDIVVNNVIVIEKIRDREDKEKRTI